MRNRLPPNSTKGIPINIIREYSNLCWIHRALDDLRKSPRSDRSDALMGQLDTLRNASSLGNANPRGSFNPGNQPSGDTSECLDHREPWYNRFVVPESVALWFSNLRVWEVMTVSVLLIMVVILITMKVFVHPN